MLGNGRKKIDRYWFAWLILVLINHDTVDHVLEQRVGMKETANHVAYYAEKIQIFEEEVLFAKLHRVPRFSMLLLLE